MPLDKRIPFKKVIHYMSGGAGLAFFAILFGLSILFGFVGALISAAKWLAVFGFFVLIAWLAMRLIKEPR